MMWHFSILRARKNKTPADNAGRDAQSKVEGQK